MGELSPGSPPSPAAVLGGHARQVTIRVPATSANLGPGFDSLGLALGLFNTVTVRQAGTSATGHLVVDAYRAVCERAGVAPLEVVAEVAGEVPRSRGLGSSATCVVAGVLAADRLHGLRLGSDELVELATAVEGHPDNVAPALLGGVVVSAQARGGRVLTCPVTLPAQAPFPALLAAIPDQALPTEESRAALPAQVAHEDAVFNASRTALLVAALGSGRHDLLAEACRDRLHQPHRAHLVPGVEDILDLALGSGALAAYVSGAGPTLMVIGPAARTREAMEAALTPHPWAWRLLEVPLATAGAQVLERRLTGQAGQ